MVGASDRSDASEGEGTVSGLRAWPSFKGRKSFYDNPWEVMRTYRPCTQMQPNLQEGLLFNIYVEEERGGGLGGGERCSLQGGGRVRRSGEGR